MLLQLDMCHFLAESNMKCARQNYIHIAGIVATVALHVATSPSHDLLEQATDLLRTVYSRIDKLDS